jgi:hypothetical protein
VTSGHGRDEVEILRVVEVWRLVDVVTFSRLLEVDEEVIPFVLEAFGWVFDVEVDWMVLVLLGEVELEWLVIRETELLEPTVSFVVVSLEVDNSELRVVLEDGVVNGVSIFLDWVVLGVFWTDCVDSDVRTLSCCFEVLVAVTDPVGEEILEVLVVVTDFTNKLVERLLLDIVELVLREDVTLFMLVVWMLLLLVDCTDDWLDDNVVVLIVLAEFWELLTAVADFWVLLLSVYFWLVFVAFVDFCDGLVDWIDFWLVLLLMLLRDFDSFVEELEIFVVGLL